MEMKTIGKAKRQTRLIDLIPGQHFWIVPWELIWNHDGTVKAHQIDKDSKIHFIDEEGPCGTADVKVIYRGDSLDFDVTNTDWTVLRGE